jgi:hypothetical protein
MLKPSARKLTLAATLLALTVSAVHAQSTPPPPPPVTTDGVTGGDPEPTSPNIVQVILSILHLA